MCVSVLVDEKKHWTTSEGVCVCVCVCGACSGPMIATVICCLLPATVITVVDMVLRALWTQATRLSLDACQSVCLCVCVLHICTLVCACACDLLLCVFVIELSAHVKASSTAC